MRPKREKWESEAAMCAAFIEIAESEGWTAYPETGGFDILLVAADGTQMGVEAKLHPNVAVLSQALDHGRALDERIKTGPDYRAVLVPRAPWEFRVVTQALRLELFELPPNRASQKFRRGLMVAPRGCNKRSRERRIRLPAVVPTFAAGEPSPRKMSPWRVSALRLCALLRQGPVSGAVFKAYGLRPSQWVTAGWVENTGEKDGRFSIYRIGAAEQFPDWGYEAEREALIALGVNGPATAPTHGAPTHERGDQ